jgi:ATP-binding protein involved in chromosome partitioning
MARQYGVDLLGALPLEPRIREGGDQGRPIVAVEPESRAAELYREIARKVAGKLAVRARDYSGRFPKIVIENT